MQQNVVSFLCSQSLGLCLFIGELSSLLLRDIKEKLLLLPFIFVVRIGILFLRLSSFRFVEGLLSCFFHGIISLLLLEFSLYYTLKDWIHGKILYKFGFVMEYFDFSIYGN